jgi:hypothetical protein
MSLVDVSGQNRTCLPSTPYAGGGGNLGPPWKVGFSETAGQRERYVSRAKRKITTVEYSSSPQSFQECMHITFILFFKYYTFYFSSTESSKINGTVLVCQNTIQHCKDDKKREPVVMWW